MRGHGCSNAGRSMCRACRTTSSFMTSPHRRSLLQYFCSWESPCLFTGGGTTGACFAKLTSLPRELRAGKLCTAPRWHFTLIGERPNTSVRDFPSVTKCLNRRPAIPKAAVLHGQQRVVTGHWPTPAKCSALAQWSAISGTDGQWDRNTQLNQ